ncbi:cyclic nucleotide-binding protein [Pilimelia anulata]|uniref:cyclic nucleotide-binding protein n=1 Tax=Pilimelia anulata TaxID=53371 RepID=UPI00166A0351|nr:cyclic nucleotide-binding protein [Pilimelia anulata]
MSAADDLLHPHRARPVLRAGVERVAHTSVRGEPYVMLRSPDPTARAHYLRLTAAEAELTLLMDGSRSVNQLIAEYTRTTGRLASEQVVRVIADLAANRMLDGDPPAPAPARSLGARLLAVLGGRRIAVADIDGAATLAYRGLGWLLRKPAVLAQAVVAVLGVVLFAWAWSTGVHPLFRTGGSYGTGLLILLLLHVFALAVHELGHALAAKHAGREVPAGGVLLYFGIPSVFVDTTDAWLAGRRARLTVTAAGPAATLVLAGAAQLVGLVLPPVAPVAFALAFVCYFQTLINLCPLLPLDGHYLLADWLEIPGLRVRGLAWLSARVRGRATPWRELDGDGRLVALYGLAGLGHLVITANLAVRLWRDRASGLALGLWDDGPGGKLLLLVALGALTAPLLYAVGRWVARLLRRRAGARRAAGEVSRRLTALRRTILAGLPEGTLAGLAGHAVWRVPAAGEVVAVAGRVPAGVLVVVAGVAEARAPGDVAGTVRQRIGAGGIIGLAPALRGTSSPLTWYVGRETELLAIPASAVVAAMSPPIPDPGATERGEAELLFADTPALEWLPEEDRLGLAAAATPTFLNPGQPVTLTPDRDAVVIASGEVTLPDGRGLRRGTLIGPLGDGAETEVGVARTPVRLWTLAAQAGSPLLVSSVLGAGLPDAHGAVPPVRVFAGAGVIAATGAAPADGPHPTDAYPPLAAPPGPPPAPARDRDRGFQRGLWWLVTPVLVTALVLCGSQALPAAAWSELPDDRLLLTAEKGAVDAVVGGAPRRLDAGDRAYLAAGDRVTAADRATATFTYRGGATTQLCAGGELVVGALGGERAAGPRAELELAQGTLIADTAATSTAYPALSLTVRGSAGLLTNAGAARYAVSADRTAVVRGGVLRDGAPLATSAGEVACDAETGFPTETPPTLPPTFAPTATATPTTSPSASPSPTPSATPSPTPSPTSAPTTPPSRPTTGPTKPQPDKVAPRITGLSASPDAIDQGPPPAEACKPPERIMADTATVTVSAADATDGAGALAVTVGWSTSAAAGEVTLTRDGGRWTGSFKVGYADGHKTGGKIAISATVTDKAGNTGRSGTSISLNPCKPT